jgi:hypothetical protein
MTANGLVKLLVLTLASLAVADVHAQTTSSGAVSGQGFVEIKKQPDIVRVEIDTLAKGKTIGDALAKLRERRQHVQKQLESLGAIGDSIEFGKTVIVNEKSDRNDGMQRMIMRQMQQLQNGGKKPGSKPKEAPPIVVAAHLKAEFQLRETDPDDLLAAAHMFEERLKAIDLGGTKDLKQTSAQDEELEQEQGENPFDNNGDSPKLGEPLFLYVSKVSDDEQAKARAQAFKKAERHAQQLARAAQAELGPLHQLDDNSSSYSETEYTTYPFGSWSSSRMQTILERLHGGGHDGKSSNEAVGLQPGKVSLRIALTASFHLKLPAGKKQ